MTPTKVLGEELSYWAELQKTRSLSERDLIRENMRLRAKVTYYEDQIKAMVKYKETVDD